MRTVPQDALGGAPVSMLATELLPLASLPDEWRRAEDRWAARPRGDGLPDSDAAGQATQSSPPGSGRR
jgi:hypothetical protein